MDAARGAAIALEAVHLIPARGDPVASLAPVGGGYLGADAMRMHVKTRWPGGRKIAVVAVCLAAVAVLASSCSSDGDDGEAQAAGAQPGDAATTLASAAPAVTEPLATTVAPTVGPPKVVFDRAIGQGDQGDYVAYLQQRLIDLHFDPGPLDGRFGPSVAMAVWAYQKLIGLSGDDVTGDVTPELWSLMQDAFVVTPQISTPGAHLEVYLPQQVMILFKDDQPALITHISTGNNADWCEKGVCGVAITPGGEYTFQRRVSGWREAELGLLYNPVYFNGGIAVHGALNVPIYPASHGCVRIPMHIAEYFPTLVETGNAVYVFDGKEDPRTYGAQAPPPNRKDPDWVEPPVSFDDTDQTDNTVPGAPATAPDGSETSLPEITASTAEPPRTDPPDTTTSPPSTEATPPSETATTATTVVP